VCVCGRYDLRVLDGPYLGHEAPDGIQLLKAPGVRLGAWEGYGSDGLAPSSGEGGSGGGGLLLARRCRGLLAGAAGACVGCCGDACGDWCAAYACSLCGGSERVGGYSGGRFFVRGAPAVLLAVDHHAARPTRWPIFLAVTALAQLAVFVVYAATHSQVRAEGSVP